MTSSHLSEDNYETNTADELIKEWESFIKWKNWFEKFMGEQNKSHNS